MIVDKAVKEAQVIKSLTNLFREIDEDSIARILNWANEVYNTDRDNNPQMNLFDLPQVFYEKNP